MLKKKYYKREKLKLLTYMLLQFILKFCDMSFSLFFGVVHLCVQGFASSSYECGAEFILLTSNLFDLAEFRGKSCDLMRFQGESSLLCFPQLILDRDLLSRPGVGWWRCSLWCRWLCQDYLIANTTLRFLLASYFGRYNNERKKISDRSFLSLKFNLMQEPCQGCLSFSFYTKRKRKKKDGRPRIRNRRKRRKRRRNRRRKRKRRGKRGEKKALTQKSSYGSMTQTHEKEGSIRGRRTIVSRRRDV